MEVPIFVTEESNDPVSLLKKLSAWSMGGFWLGGTHMKPNTSFVRDVSAAIPKDARVVLACQKGLRWVADIGNLTHSIRRTMYADGTSLIQLSRLDIMPWLHRHPKHKLTYSVYKPEHALRGAVV